MGNRVFGRLAAVAAGGVLALAAAAPAFADDHTTTIDIKDDHVPSAAEGFTNQECDGPFEDLNDGEDGFHFVLTQFGGDSADVAMFLDFEDGDGDPVPTIQANPNDFVKTGQVVHLWLIVPAGWTLVGAWGEAPTADLGANPQFNLSHTCPGEPGNGNGETPPPTTPPPGNGETPPPGNGETPPPGEEEPGLPVTGMQVGGLVALGVALLAAGAAMMVVRRRGSITDLAEEA